jgi:hypothetical protein
MDIDEIVKLCDVQGHAYTLQYLNKGKPMETERFVAMIARFRRTFFDEKIIGQGELVLKEPDAETKCKLFIQRLKELSN